MLKDIVDAFKNWLKEQYPILIPVPVQDQDRKSGVSYPGVNRYVDSKIWRVLPILLVMLPGLLAANSDLTKSDSKLKTILFMGDSITAGYGLDETQAFPALFETIIQEKGYHYHVINAGVSGDTSSGGLRRIKWLLRSNIDILVLELGANDGLRGIDLTVTKENLQKIIDETKIKNPDVKIVVAGMQVPPNLGETYTKQFRELFPSLAKSNNATLIPFLLEGVAGEPSLNLPDGIHPNAAGHSILAENVWSAMSAIIE